METPGAGRSRRKSQHPDGETDDSSSATDRTQRDGTPVRASRRKSHINGNISNDGSNGYIKGEILESERKVDAVKVKAVNVLEAGLDPKIDYSGHFDFGGPLGVSAMMIGFPLLMYYMWIGATYYEGKFPSREPGQNLVDFFKHLGSLAFNGAFPSLKAWTIYWTFGIFEMACYCLLPGVTCYGKPLPHEGGKQMKYYCSGVWSFYTTIVVMGALHFSGLFPLYTIIDEFGPIMTVAIISGYLVAIVAYISAIYRGAQHRMSGSVIYDFFMGAELNPRLFGVLDFKMFFEVRLPWFILFGLSCATAARQYEQFGYVSGEVGFLVMAHYLYANACSKGEECIVTTW